MNPADITSLVRVLSIIAGILQQLGVPGLVGLVLGGPAAVLITVLVLNHRSAQKQEKALAAYRKDMGDLVEKSREDASKQMEIYRADTQSILRNLGKEHSETAQYYRDNVELVKSYERVADDLSDLVATNVQVLERLVGKIDNNLFCPVARERARGQS
jgi:gas vesicle protein